jgi:hypothetical protein
MKFNRIGIPPDEAQFLETRSSRSSRSAAGSGCRRTRSRSLRGRRSRTSNRRTGVRHRHADGVGGALGAGDPAEAAPGHRPDLFAELLFRRCCAATTTRAPTSTGRWSTSARCRRTRCARLENMNPGGAALDDYYMQSNMLPLDRIGDDATAPATPAAAAPAPATPSAPDGIRAAGPTAARPRAQLDAQVAVLRPIFLDAADRVLRKEVLGAPRPRAPEGRPGRRFARWAAEFYAEQRGFMVEALTPPVQAIASIAAHVRGAALATSTSRPSPRPRRAQPRRVRRQRGADAARREHRLEPRRPGHRPRHRFQESAHAPA